MRRLTVLAALLAACGTGERSEAAGVDASRVGWVHGPCLAITNSTLDPGTSVRLVLSGDPQALIDTTVIGPADSGEQCYALMDDRRNVNHKPGTFFYALSEPDDTSFGLGVALLGAPAIELVEGRARGDLDGDGSPETFSECSTSEGVRFHVWSGEPSVGDAVWSAYYYLGYDTEPTCP